MSSFNYDKTEIHTRYDAAQKLPDDVMSEWMDVIRRCVAGTEVSRILDLGSGTGRFLTPLQLCFDADVIGMDPAWKMLSAVASAGAPRQFRVLGRAEQIPVRSHSIDLVFMSVVWHLLSDQRQACREISRVLRDKGYFCLRTPTLETLDSETYLRFFPTADKINRLRMPSRAAFRQFFSEGNLALCNHVIVKHRQSATMAEYVERVALRALSDLASLSDEEFALGMQGLRRYGATVGADIRPAIDIDLFVLRRLVERPCA
jgi:ubiquinone/menaquinone biosynthesis C-methylase UbiE